MIRRLAWAALSFSVAVFLAHFAVPGAYLLLCAALCATLSLTALAFHGKNRQRALLLCLFLALGFARYWAQWTYVITPSEAFAGQTRTVTARVTDYPLVNDGYTTVYVRLTDDALPNRKAMFYCYGRACDDLRPGDVITGEVRLRSALTRMGEETDVYIAKGVALRGYVSGTVTVIGRWAGSVLYAPKEAAHALQGAYDRLFPARTAMFLKALTTGEKTDVYLDPEVYVSMSTAGIMHVIAVSGMHVMLLVWMVSKLFGARRGAVVSVGAILFFAVMTGGSPSVLRAALMTGLYLLAPGLRREPDDVTGLSAALFALLAWNPCAAGSVSLQLSFSAMAGLVLLSPKIDAWMAEKLPSHGRVLPRIRQSLSATLGVMILSTPITAYRFGYVPLYGALANLVVLWLVPICFIGGFLGGILGLLWAPLGKLLGLALTVPTEGVFLTARLVSKLPCAAVYLSHPYAVCWLVLVYALFGVAWLFKGKRPYRPAFPFCLSVLSLCLLMGVLRADYRQGTTVTAVDVGQGESISILRGDTTLVVDCGGDFNGAAGDRTGAYLLGRGRKRIDLLVLTHLHEDHANGVTRLMARIPVERLIVRADVDDSDEQLDEILSYAERYGTEVTFLEETTCTTLGELELTLYLSPYKGENQGIVVQAGVDGYETLILGDVNETTEKWLVREFDLPDGEVLVAGHHGAKTSTGETLLDAYTPETALISVGYNNYGHPREEVLERFSRRNVQIYRTDTAGTLEIRKQDDGKERDS